ncbi:MAG: tRNA 2-thiouridine(34) synthase MnmA [Ruminococcus sp.]|nr:tRNA 2-thiouridine(34) synthase MnmA [Ruminococcus sp.]
MSEIKNNKALIAMSGGVDSSVAAYIMQNQGFECTGVTMKLFYNEEIGVNGESSCCSLSDVEDAKSVAYRLGIPYYVFNFTGDFKKHVIDRFVETYEQGGTPNPCIDCNRFLKFEKLFNRAKELQIDYIVTGHYAQVVYDEKLNRYLLKKAVDETKDQSYVLYSLTQEQLAHIKFPLGSYHKSEIREIASQQGFLNAHKKDSQDICFVPDGDYASFIERYTGKTYPSGNFVDLNGNKLGVHNGSIRYTIGQRKGLGLSLKTPHYVCKKCMETNQVVLGENSDLFSSELDAVDINLIAYDYLKEPIRVKAKVRYRHKEQWATVSQPEPDRLHIVFDEPQRAITSGQAVVLYQDDIVVGGGTIV